MTNEEIEEFVRQLDEQTRDMCVYPNQQTLDCEDCYLCRVNYFNWVREDLRSCYEY